ncbi:MAG: bifunctional folylpolyglutamate synthase/dihydrofolate synthase [Desulfobacterales bacterium]|nr:MAG: bifunctional folylpolyglutamate synthase/dihydrofolate synthase [Desulfobacterales bacterium]
MYGLRRFGIKLGLSTIKNILNGLGNPQDNFQCIHVAGTNGKGSVASALASILNVAGYHVGLYTSPHLIRFNERIRINEQQITNDDVVAAYQAVRRAHYGQREPTFFEFATAMALYEFGRQNVDWAVIETGMGGRLDATNMIKPALSVITNVSLEHRDYLGNTLSQIAREKAGIIKKQTPVITGVKQKSAISVVKEATQKKAAPLYRYRKEFTVKRYKSGGFSYYGIAHNWHNLQTRLVGDHQIDNSALVLAAIELLNQKKAGISMQNIKKGLTDMHWPGRLEIVSTDPFIMLDGAHNLIAARYLARYLSQNLADRRITLVIGILNDKPYASILKSLLPLCRRVILTRARIDRALDPQKLYTVAKETIADITIIPDVTQAVAHAVEEYRPKEAICIAGSLYVVGEAMEAFEKGLIPSIKKIRN